MSSDDITRKLEELIEPLLAGLSLELVDLEYRPGRKGHLCLYIDKPAGATLGDCEKASREVSSLLDAYDPIPHQYVLEVSTPGVERPLKKPEDFQRFSGEAVKIYLEDPEGSKRKALGILQGTRNGVVLLTLEGGETAEFPLEQISRAHLWYRPTGSAPKKTPSKGGVANR